MADRDVMKAARALLEAVDAAATPRCDEPECAGLCVREAGDALRAALDAADAADARPTPPAPDAAAVKACPTCKSDDRSKRGTVSCNGVDDVNGDPLMLSEDFPASHASSVTVRCRNRWHNAHLPAPADAGNVERDAVALLADARKCVALVNVNGYYDVWLARCDRILAADGVPAAGKGGQRG